MVEPSSNRARALIVLGMHRSGTSAMAGLLHRLGVELGPDLMPPNPYNEAGHWEHAGIVGLHDRLLAALGSSWDDVCPLPERWWERPEVAPLRAELLALARRDFGGRPLWALKDPRLCRLLPLWHGIAADLGCRPCFVLMVRNPAEVTASLQRRDGFDPAHSHLAWIEHVLAAEQHSRGASRVFVTYDELVRDWRVVVDRLAEAFDVAWPTPPDTAAPEVDRFVSAGLRHHTTTDGGDAPAWAAALHGALLDAARGDERALQERVATVTSELQGLYAWLCPVVRDLRRQVIAERQARLDLADRVARLTETLREREASLQHAETESMLRGTHLATLERHFAGREAHLVHVEQENAARGEALRALEIAHAALTRDLAAVRDEAVRLRDAWTALQGSAAGRMLLRFAPRNGSDR